MAENRILKKLLDRLFASLINGPSLNCRPHSSRQRIDLVQFAKLKDKTPDQILRSLLGEERAVKIAAKVAVPVSRFGNDGERGEDAETETALTAEENAARQAYSDQRAVLAKLRSIAEDARTYENDTGVHVLQIGFPLLSLPVGSGGPFGQSRRVLAPLAFISLSMTLQSGPTPSVRLECRGQAGDLVVPNVALLSWLERQTGQSIGELFGDEEGTQPWKELIGIARRVCEIASVQLPAIFGGEVIPDSFALSPAPTADSEAASVAAVLPAAVVGLYPVSNQGLLRDMQALVGGEPATGPIESFITAGASLEAAAPASPDEPHVEKRTRNFTEERLITTADPCQTRAVRLARTSRGLVIYGPPGTGKSQTIANVIGDHLARGERILFVCDKRTALDVVMNRLEAMKLGTLCGIVHDPQRDQRNLFKSIREQLDGLADLKTDASADGTLLRIDAELQRLHSELIQYHAAVMVRPNKDALSFHELMGRWLALPTFDVDFDQKLLESAPHHAVEENAQAIGDVCDRAANVHYVSNPWTPAVGISLEAFLVIPGQTVRDDLAALMRAAVAADAVIDPATPRVPDGIDPDVIVAARNRAADALQRVRSEVNADLRKHWASVEPDRVARAVQIAHDAEASAEKLGTSPLDGELLEIVRPALPTVAEIARNVAALDAYLAVVGTFFGFLAFGKKSSAAKVLATYGLQPNVESARRVSAFLTGLKSRLLTAGALARLDWPAAAALPEDADLLNAVQQHRTLLTFMGWLCEEPAVADIRAALRAALVNADEPTELLRGLRATAARLEQVRRVTAESGVRFVSDETRQKVRAAMLAGQAIAPVIQPLAEHGDTIENVLRVRHGLQALPPSLQPAAAQLVRHNVPGDAALSILRKASDANELIRRLKANPVLMTADAQQLQSSFARYRQLDAEKKQLTRAAVMHCWATRQKERLLASTGSRLNALGAELRRRLTIRGERAMRLRQVVQAGQRTEGGDPLYDLRPVWMASPETVAQIFPRMPLFDAVIFDEASQCRLEEALPVLLRARRVVIAGDPKQLPPTRFFETALAASNDEEIETDQQLFESQQGEIEDLLAAALNIEIEECYLDVHYRSRNSDLIEFSNNQFYNARLQPIPGHPRNRARYAPLTLYRVDGVYEKRANAAEAQRVCQIVHDLLKRASPPSIGIACFNVTQRDLILEELEELAAGDAEFGKALAAARERRSSSSFEGLFVKNLENVQGDERDHIIISTTYGPDPKGRFYRRFGPLGSAGGGRRLNVLVTRARDEVHLVTSIPQAVYRNLPPVPPGQAPGGAWLLFSYLVYAEQLAEVYEQNHRILEQGQAAQYPVVNVRASRFPSVFAGELAKRLQANNRIGSDVHWGNDGFCVDLALHHPQRAEDVTIGLLCDMNRFEQAADPVEWEIFRTAILESQGWTFNRIWTPHFFRDRKPIINSVIQQAQSVANQTDDPQAIRVTPQQLDH
jgi:hypothetical protein